jgi:BirA family biotin operon repressor/biotin-[acetyl-CoA-carboxylase] ligase
LIGDDILFSIEEFDIKLDTELIGRNFVYMEEVDSTNSFIMGSREYNSNGTVAMAEYQLKGRGRKQRSWVSSKDQALTFSILLNEDINFKNINLLSLGAAVSIAQALENLHQLNVGVKWPNDVLVDGKKIAGILIESTSKGSKLEKIAIGVGLNVNQPNFTGKFNIRPTSIRMELKKPVGRERLLSEILNRFEEMMQDLKINSDKILNDWKSRCNLIGEKIHIVEDDKEKFGIFEDIDQNGFMLLKTKEGIETIQVGDISIK